MSRHSKITLYTLLVALLTARLAQAEEIFTWQDNDGVTHYSQWAPEDGEKVSTLVVNSSNPPGYDPLDDPYSIRNQAERMNETWQALDDKRTERREKRREEAERATRFQAADFNTYPYYSSPFYYGPSYRPIYRPIHRPIHRPGVRPLPADGQLQRPGRVNRVQRRQFNATSDNQYDPFRSAGISAPESGRQSSQPLVEF